MSEDDTGNDNIEIDEIEAGDVQVEIHRSSQEINKDDRPGIVAKTVYKGKGAFKDAHFSSSREVIESNISAMVFNAGQEAKGQGLESTLEVIDNHNDEGEVIGRGYAGNKAEPCTAFEFAFNIELQARQYKAMLEKLDNAGLDEKTHSFVEQLIAKAFGLAHNNHMLWVANNEKAILAGPGNFNSTSRYSVETREQAVALHRKYQREDPSLKPGELKKMVSDEMGGIPPTTLQTWLGKY